MNYEVYIEENDPVILLSDTINEMYQTTDFTKYTKEEYSGKIKVGKVNVDEEESLSREYGIVSIPTVILFKNGKPEKTSIGLVPKETLVSMLG